MATVRAVTRGQTAKITDQVRPLYDCTVLEVLFTDFVMQ